METKILFNLFQQNGIHDILPNIQKYVDEYNIDYLLDNVDILVNDKHCEVKKLDEKATFNILCRLQTNMNIYNDLLHHNTYIIRRSRYINTFDDKKAMRFLKQNINQRNDLTKVLKYTLTPNIITSLIELIKST
jgi:uncharacterized membrane protein